MCLGTALTSASALYLSLAGRLSERREHLVRRALP